MGLMALLGTDYLDLLDSFNRLGKLRFTSEWSGEEIKCETPYAIFNSSEATSTPEEARYTQIRLELFEAFWHQKDQGISLVKSYGINASGQRSEFDYSIWKCQTEECVFSIKEGRVRCQFEDGNPEYRIHIDRATFTDFLLKKYFLKMRSRPPKGGAPSTYVNDWDRYVKWIVEQYESDNPPSSKSACAARLIDELTKPDPPSSTPIRDKISDLIS